MPSTATRLLLLDHNKSTPYAPKVLAITNLIGYWKLDETSGTVAANSSAAGSARNGTISGAVLASIAGPGPSMGTAPLFDGVNDYVDVYSASLAGAFSGAELTISVWARVDAVGTWSDSTVRREVYFQSDGNNRQSLTKSATANLLQGFQSAGGTLKSDTYNAGAPTAWFHHALTVSKSGDAVKHYVNGSQVNSTLTALGVYAGALAATTTVIGAADTTGTGSWKGYLAHVAVFARALTAAEILTLATAA